MALLFNINGYPPIVNPDAVVFPGLPNPRAFFDLCGGAGTSAVPGGTIPNLAQPGELLAITGSPQWDPDGVNLLGFTNYLQAPFGEATIWTSAIVWDSSALLNTTAQRPILASTFGPSPSNSITTNIGSSVHCNGLPSGAVAPESYVECKSSYSTLTGGVTTYGTNGSAQLVAPNVSALVCTISTLRADGSSAIYLFKGGAMVASGTYSAVAGRTRFVNPDTKWCFGGTPYDANASNPCKESFILHFNADLSGQALAVYQALLRYAAVARPSLSF
jgi:hypothetical protein